MSDFAIWIAGVIGLLGSPNQLLESATAGPAGPPPVTGSVMITEAGNPMITQAGDTMLTES